eukprot:925003-Amorphochlora_amoeboformis.AAC.1
MKNDDTIGTNKRITGGPHINDLSSLVYDPEATNIARLTRARVPESGHSGEPRPMPDKMRNPRNPI